MDANLQIVKAFGLYNAQDIEVGDSKTDKSFIIEGSDEVGIKNLLSSQMLQGELLDFFSSKPKIHLIPGSLEILDSCLVYTEGPYTGKFSINVRESSKKIIEKLQKIVQHIETP